MNCLQPCIGCRHLCRDKSGPNGKQQTLSFDERQATKHPWPADSCVCDAHKRPLNKYPEKETLRSARYYSKRDAQDGIPKRKHTSGTLMTTPHALTGPWHAPALDIKRTLRTMGVLKFAPKCVSCEGCMPITQKEKQRPRGFPCELSQATRTSSLAPCWLPSHARQGKSYGAVPASAMFECKVLVS